MTKTELDNQLAVACDRIVPDLNEIKKLILAGADTNQVNEYDDNIFDDTFVSVLYDAGDDASKSAKAVEEIKEIIPLMIEKGWNIKKYGIGTMDRFTRSTYDPLTFELFRYMLQYDLTDRPKDYKEVLDSVGSEESYQRCCVNNHELENLFYSIYEMVEAKMKGRDYTGIGLYYNAIGTTIDKIVYFDENDTTLKKTDFTEYNADIGFVCGDKLLVLRKSVNILCMNDRLADCPQIDASHLFGENVIGEKIRSVSFDHKEIKREKTGYGQPTIIMELENGKKLKFTHNFGEFPGKKTQSRFWVE